MPHYSTFFMHYICTFTGIRNALLQTEDNECPTCHRLNVSLLSIIANNFLRAVVSSFKNNTEKTMSYRTPCCSRSSTNITGSRYPITLHPTLLSLLVHRLGTTYHCLHHHFLHWLKGEQHTLFSVFVLHIEMAIKMLKDFIKNSN